MKCREEERFQKTDFYHIHLPRLLSKYYQRQVFIKDEEDGEEILRIPSILLSMKGLGMGSSDIMSQKNIEA